MKHKNSNQQIIELGNELLRQYCPHVISPVTHISKWTIRDTLIMNIAQKWGLSFDSIPSEETFYRTFRSGTASSAMCEKMAILYFANLELQGLDIISKDYKTISDRQRIQTQPYWNKFLTRNRRKFFKGGSGKQKSDLKTVKKGIATEKLHLLESIKKQRLNQNYGNNLLNKIIKHEKKMNFKQAAELLQGNIQKDETALAWKYVNEGIYLELQNKFDAAKLLYNKAITLQPYKAIFYHQLGTLQDFLGSYREALKTHQKGLAINKKQYLEPNKEIGISYNNLFSVWTNMGDLDKAGSCILQAEANLQKTTPELSEEKVALYQNLGLFYQNTGDIRLSINFRKKAVSLCERLYEDQSEITAKAYHNLGVSISHGKQWPSALKWFEKALKIETNILGVYHYTTAQTLNSIGFLWLRKKEFTSALFCFKSSLEVVKKIYPFPHSEIGLRVNNIGLVLIYLKKYREAEINIKAAINIYSKTLNKNNVRFGICYFNLALLYYKQQMFTKANDFIKNAMTYYKDLSPDHGLVARTLELQEAIQSRKTKIHSSLF